MKKNKIIDKQPILNMKILWNILQLHQEMRHVGAPRGQLGATKLRGSLPNEVECWDSGKSKSKDTCDEYGSLNTRLIGPEARNREWSGVSNGYVGSSVFPTSQWNDSSYRSDDTGYPA